MEIIEINDKNRDAILDIFDFSVNEEGFVTDKSGENVICRYSDEPIKQEHLAVFPGSKIVINNYAYCISEYLTEFLMDSD